MKGFQQSNCRDKFLSNVRLIHKLDTLLRNFLRHSHRRDVSCILVPFLPTLCRAVLRQFSDSNSFVLPISRAN